MYTIYGTRSCPYCIRSRQLLKTRGIEFEEIDLTKDTALRDEISAKYNYQTVPMIVKDDEFIEGFDALQKKDAAGTL